jgi:hypothetical protein
MRALIGEAPSKSAGGVSPNTTWRRASTAPGGRAANSGSSSVMFQPRRLRTRSPSSVETSARKPSHLTSNNQFDRVGSGPGRESIGSGSRNGGNLARGWRAGVLSAREFARTQEVAAYWRREPPRRGRVRIPSRSGTRPAPPYRRDHSLEEPVARAHSRAASVGAKPSDDPLGATRSRREGCRDTQ